MRRTATISALFVVLSASGTVAQDVLVDGLVYPEGAVVTPGGVLYICDGGASRIYRVVDGELIVDTEDTEAASGMDIAPNGLYICQFGADRFSRVEPEGDITTLVKQVDGLQLESPNDVVSDSVGNAYFTANFRSNGGFRGSGVVYYGIDGTTKILIDTLGIANGIALSPDERILYVGDLEENEILEYDLEPGPEAVRRGRLALFEAAAYPEGIAVHPNGSIFVSLYGRGKLIQLSPDGRVLDRVSFPVGSAPTNVALGGPSQNTVYLIVPGARKNMVRRVAGGSDIPVDQQVARLREAGMDGKVYVMNLR